MHMPALDYADARKRMVDGQIRPNKVTDPRILNAMRTLPRERFVPDRLKPFAYIDEDLPLGGGRVLMEPVIIARLLQLADPAPRERALVVGAGTGYGAAVLAACHLHVTALEEDPALLAIAREVLPSVAPSVTLVEGPLNRGLEQGAPWDFIVIEGGVREIPPCFADQLRGDCGRLVTVLCRSPLLGQAVLAEPVAGGLRCRPEFDCATPLLPGFVPKPGFVF